MKESTKGVFYTVIASFLWGSSFPVITAGYKLGIEPVYFSAARFWVAIALLIIILTYKYKSLKFIFIKIPVPVWIVGILNSLGFLFQYTGQSLTTSTHSSLLSNIGLPFTALAGIIVFKEKFTVGKVLAILFAVLGTFLVTTEGDISRLYGGSLKGDMLCVLASISWTIYFILFKKYLINIKDLLLLNYQIFIVTTVVITAASFVFTTNYSVITRPTIVIIVLYTGIFCSVIPYLLWNVGLKRITVATSAILLMLEIVFAGILSFIFLGEVMKIYGYIGAFLILFSSVLVIKR